ncbi:hypothetical protein NEOLEDRAFT_403322 [Neolentinus lepideus HHB14362 ss-1]|uniref:Uncharacterized protein n=1 Tax=Neolentinus lepideus HHB14362 ss-1 TaxID=1314782 RepID=A0A165S393_9AGAM|nr:hypothetical protein NEOLEDRAFT_403322 [Neolentinus lepideus HHB14362 ss-1]
MGSLYDFATKSCFNQWDIAHNCHTMSSQWAWDTLWMPLFHLRLSSRWVLTRISVKILMPEICDCFFQWPLVAFLTSIQARNSIEALRRLISEFRGLGSALANQDPVLSLMLEATRPLLEFAGVLHEERLITVEYGGYDIPRYVRLSRMKEICKAIISLMMCELTPDDIAMSPSLLHAVALYYDAVCQRELQALAVPYRRSTDSFHHRRADALLRYLPIKGPEKSLNCIGIAAGIPYSGMLGVFADHYHAPWAAGRTYDSSQPFMLLVAEDSYRDLRWVLLSDMNEAEYDPLAVPPD